MTTRTSKSVKLNQEQLLEALRLKKECNAKAQAVVESLLEQCIQRENFLHKLKDINQSHYDDIVDERNILMYCGYPLCQHCLKDVPTKKYQISTTTNKVYDITDRKKFCSSHCFKASMYIKSQLLTSPLWLRNQESVPEFKLLE